MTDCLARGPLIFCLLLSMFLSMRASGEQSSLVFSGVFTIVWIGEAVVTLQIKLLGGNMYVPIRPFGYGLDVRLTGVLTTVRSSNRSALSDTRSFLWLSLPFSVPWVSRLSHEYRYIWF